MNIQMSKFVRTIYIYHRYWQPSDWEVVQKSTNSGYWWWANHKITYMEDE
jgi:hypothetical protein